MKKLIASVLAIALMAGLAGCSKEAPEQKPETKKPTEVTVYSPHPADPLNAGVRLFEEKTGIKVNVVAAGTGELLKRIEAEKDNPLADVLWGGGAESLAAYNEYFDSFKSTEDGVISAANKDAGGKWVGESPLPMVIMYNKKLVAEENIPTGWEDLLKPVFKGQIAYADPAKSGSSFTILATMVTAFGGKEKGWDFIKQFVANLDGKVLGSSSGVYKGVYDGEYAVGLTLEKSAQEYVKADPDKVGFIYPKEGTSTVPDGIALVKGAKNKEAAEIFINFMLSAENQKMMAETYNRRPVRSDLPAPEGLIPLNEIKVVDYDFAWASGSKAEILEEWKNIIVGE